MIHCSFRTHDEEPDFDKALYTLRLFADIWPGNQSRMTKIYIQRTYSISGILANMEGKKDQAHAKITVENFPMRSR